MDSKPINAGTELLADALAAAVFERVKVMLAAEPPRPANDDAGRAVVLLPLERKARGFPSNEAFRRWCKAHRVPIIKDGRKEWVCPAEIDAAVRSNAPLPATPHEKTREEAAAEAVARLFAGKS